MTVGDKHRLHHLNLFCRWKRNDTGDMVYNEDSKKPILQFVSVKRRDNGQWAIPGVCCHSFSF